METTMKKTKTGLITLRTESGWVPWGIGTFMDGVRMQIENGARAFGYSPLSPRSETVKVDNKEKTHV